MTSNLLVVSLIAGALVFGGNGVGSTDSTESPAPMVQETGVVATDGQVVSMGETGASTTDSPEEPAAAVQDTGVGAAGSQEELNSPNADIEVSATDETEQPAPMAAEVGVNTTDGEVSPAAVVQDAGDSAKDNPVAPSTVAQSVSVSNQRSCVQDSRGASGGFEVPDPVMTSLSGNNRDEWDVALKGSITNGDYLYYAKNSAGNEAAIIVIDNATGTHTSYIGSIYDLGDGVFEIVDDDTGNSFFIMVDSTDNNGSMSISLGSDAVGVLSPCPVSDVLDVIDHDNADYPPPPTNGGIGSSNNPLEPGDQEGDDGVGESNDQEVSGGLVADDGVSDGEVRNLGNGSSSDDLETPSVTVDYSAYDGWYDEFADNKQYWENAFEGETNTDLVLYYVYDNSESKGAIFVIDYVEECFNAYMGDLVFLGNGNYAIVDSYSNNTLYYYINDVGYGGNVYVSFGGNESYGTYGYGVLSPCAPSNVISTVNAVYNSGYELVYI